MAAGAVIKHKRKSGAFANGELAAGEWGLDTTNSVWYYSANGTTVVSLSSLFQAVLVSGTNIKTINSTSLLGSGNITVGGVSQGQLKAARAAMP